jgi:hypothetical protein
MKWVPEDWEIVSRKTNNFWFEIFVTLILGWFQGATHPHSSATWTIRQKSTGITRRVTALSEREAADKIAKGWFDAD